MCIGFHPHGHVNHFFLNTTYHFSSRFVSVLTTTQYFRTDQHNENLEREHILELDSHFLTMEYPWVTGNAVDNKK
jgi:hypothetical protein